MDATLFFGQVGMALALGLGAAGSSLGIGAAGRAAAGAWAKEAKAGKNQSFTYIILTGMPLSQTIYAFILMTKLAPLVTGNPQFTALHAGTIFTIGLACGLAEFFSAWMQGVIGASAVRCLSEGEGKGFAFLLITMGIAESVGLLGFVFLMLKIPSPVAG